jgi:hypothetical protein
MIAMTQQFVRKSARHFPGQFLGIRYMTQMSRAKDFLSKCFNSPPVGADFNTGEVSMSKKLDSYVKVVGGAVVEIPVVVHGRGVSGRSRSRGFGPGDAARSGFAPFEKKEKKLSEPVRS